LANKYPPNVGTVTLFYDAFRTPVAVPDRYRPSINLLGVQASNKIIAADGTRYFDNATGRLDFDINPDPSIFGSFLESGPIFQSSTAYGRSGPGAPTNQKLSFRHPSSTLRVVYYDGHVETMKQKQAWTDATPWYPGGSIYNGTSGTVESQAFHTNGQVLP
jgi:hypothetical protein